MAITGAHMLLYTSEPDACRAVLRDVFGFPLVDAGYGWLIFKLPPSEIAVHPADAGPQHQVTFMCDDLETTIAELREKGMAIKGEPHRERWGIAVTVTLPGDCDVMVYQPLHPVAASL